MARLPAVFALAAVLVLAAGIGFGNGQLVLPLNTSTGCLAFPASFSLPPMRIISKADTSLSVAADGNDDLVLAKTICRDQAQLWVQDFTANPTEDLWSLLASGSNPPFALVNQASLTNPQAMQLGIDGSTVKLAPYNKAFVPASMLWTQDTYNALVDPFANVFDKIRSVKNNQLVLDALGGLPVKEGTIVGAFQDFHEGDNVMWKVEGYLSNP